MDLLVQKLLNDMTLDSYSLKSSVHTGQTQDDKFIHCQSCTFVLLRISKYVISHCSIATMRTLP